MANNCNNVNQFISYTFDSCNSGSTINLQLNQELKNVTATLVQNIDCNYHTINCSYDNLRQVSYYDILSICGLQLNSDLLITNIATGSTNNSSLATQGYVDDHGGGGGSNIRKFAMDSVDELICYCGYAPVGSAEDSAVWTITKIVTTVIGDIDNSTTITNWKWTERETI